MRYPNGLKAARLARSLALGRDVTQAEIGKAVNASQSAVQKWEAGLRKLPPMVAEKLASMLDVSRDYLLFGREDKNGKHKLSPTGNDNRIDTRVRIRNTTPVVGTVGAGGWLEVDELPGRLKNVPKIDNDYENMDQFAYLVIGKSMDQVGIFDGCYVICVTESSPRNGDKVVVERRRGQLFQRSVKEYRVTGDVIELIPRSSDPAFQPLRLDRTRMREDDDTEVALVGRVIGTVNYF